jgi:hypothetical protein
MAATLSELIRRGSWHPLADPDDPERRIVLTDGRHVAFFWAYETYREARDGLIEWAIRDFRDEPRGWVNSGREKRTTAPGQLTLPLAG